MLKQKPSSVFRSSSKTTTFVCCFVCALFCCATVTTMACPQYKVILFDSYGTIIDVNDLLETTRNVINSTDPILPTVLINLWRAKQLDYTWLRSVMKSPMTDSYQDFWAVTQDALKFSLAKLNVSLTQSQQDDLMNGWLGLSLFPDVKESLTVLKEKYKLAILSNGTPRMLREVFKANELDDLIDPANEISVDEVKLFKPHPSVYAQGENYTKFLSAY